MIELGVLVGYAAMLCTVTAFVPQSILCWRTRRTQDVSLLTWGLIGIGGVCWGLYGLHLESKPIIITNAVVIAGAVSIILAKLRFG